MRIFMVIKRLRYSGAYKMFMWVADALCNLGHDVTVLTFMPNDAQELNPNIHRINHDELAHKNIFTKILTIRKEIRNINPDVSISFLLDANVYNIFACLGLTTKSIICERNDPFKPGYRVLKFWKPLFRYADGAVYQLSKVAQYYDNIKVPTAVIPNPVLCKPYIELDPFEKRPNLINVLGRLDIFQKRHDVLIEAFARFISYYPDFKLVFYGDGLDKNRMIQKVNSLGIRKNVEFAGITNKPLEVMRTSKMFILTSDFEGIPNALIEAMSLGLPCISTDCSPGGARLLIDDGKNGFLVPQGDFKVLADKMCWLMANSTIADNIGNEAKKIADKFSEKKIADLWNEYLKKFSTTNF